MKARLLSTLVALAGMTLAAEASAQVTDESRPLSNKPMAEGFRAEAPRARRFAGPETWPAEVRAIFLGVTGGVGFANVKHPEIATPRMLGPMLSFQLGYRVSPRWSVSFVYTDFQQNTTRLTTKDQFATTTSFIRGAAGCSNCKHLGGLGADPLSTTFKLSALGPAVDVTPFGRDGLFIGASGGAALTTAIETTYGIAGTARAGFRLRPVQNLALALEGGVQGQKYSGGSAMLGYGGAEVRLNF